MQEAIANFELKFQFTHPGRGATLKPKILKLGMEVSIHAPREGCDLIRIIADRLSRVSIHAPREGCDFVAPGILLSRAKFQFTHPGRGATEGFVSHLEDREVSIHAPREGCDLRRGLSRWPRSRRFNSRTPGGVRPQEIRDYQDAIKFQFTHPGRGATPFSLNHFDLYLLFQFTHPGRGATIG